MFLITWMFDKLGYMPKVSIDAEWSFPIKKPVAKKVAKNTVKKAITRKSK